MSNNGPKRSVEDWFVILRLGYQFGRKSLRPNDNSMS